MWNAKRSLQLSRICTLLFMAALVAVLCGGPWLVRWVISSSSTAAVHHTGWFLATLYTGGVAAAWLLVCLYRLLGNIARGQYFVAANVSLLRHISWCCFAGAGICVVSAVYYIPWGLVGLAAAFMGLIVRVVKNLIAQATLLKEENDLTV